ncbi:hypothetical protein BDQ12DRAFT_683236 [Crucibulum laeve]|uniref:Xylosidase/arabinosidase n=1 Tax=Crucibulum laeve TaxID=68775 RepID=A0A5C3M1S7_9AGAR|nr:hypothetical protein BDQ12DRAFT_683236 [Crucibulum laeve]
MASSTNANVGKILKRANPSTIQDKFMVGYQGWFTCHGDGEPVGPGHHGWLHWLTYPIPDGGRPNTDLWPDVSSYSPSELYPVPGLKTKTGDQLSLFSSRNAKTVQRHFHWMAEHGVDGVFLQRFAGQCDLEGGNAGIMRIRDEVGDRVKEAAEKEGRVFAIMYDVSGVPADRIQRIIERDWMHLIRNKGILDSPNYLREKGKPVIALWGFGFDNAGHTPGLVRAITNFIRNTTPGGVYIMAGTPAHWRTAEQDADRNREFLDVWLSEFDAISPWTVGRYRTEQDADHFAETKMKEDVELLKKRHEEGGRKVDYVPVVLPGGSGYNLSEGKWGFNDIKRNGGRFLWKQISNAHRLGVHIMYGAMWDEYDEGTAFMPVVPSKRQLPVSDKYPFLALDEDGYDLPSDWYMRICGFAAEGLRSERRIHDTFPSKELQDYWSSRPRYEELNAKSGDFVSGSSAQASGAGSGDSEGQSYQEWLATQKDDKDEPPPPPYSLEADEAAAAAVPEPVMSSSANPVPAAAQVPFSSPIALSQPAASPHAHGPGSSYQHPHQPYPGSENLHEAAAEFSHPSGQATSSTSPVATPAHGLGSSAHGSGLGTHRPQHSSLGLQAQQHLQGVAGPRQSDPMTTLANDFGRQSVSPQGNVSLGRVQSLSTSPPPVHPAHPAVANQPSYGNASFSRPPVQMQTRPGSQPRPNSNSRPTSQSGYANANVASHSGHSPTNTPSSSGSMGVIPQQEPQSPGQWSQGQWPPPEWKMSARQQQQQAHYSAQPGPGQPSFTGGANLSRPNTFTASGQPPGGASLRPHASLGPSSIRPPQPQHQASTPSGGLPQVNASEPSPFPGAPSHGASAFSGPSSPTFPTPSMSFPSTPGGSNYPPVNSTYPSHPGSTYPGHTGQSFNSAQASGYPGQGWSGGPTHISPSHSPPVGATGMSPYSEKNNYHGHQGSLQQYPPPQGPQYGGVPYAGPSSSHSPSPTSHQFPTHGSPAHFPQPSGGEGGYFNNIPQPNPQTSSYPSQHGSTSPYQAFSYPHQPPLAVPPRPQTQPTHTKPSGPSFPIASSAGASALGFALTAVDKVAGRKTREQLENQVGSIAQSGSKLFSKFTK